MMPRGDMKKVFSSRNLTEVDFVKSLLEAEGVEAFLRNEHSAHTAAAGFGFAMAFAWPELWVADEQVQAASEIVSRFKSDRGDFIEPAP